MDGGEPISGHEALAALTSVREIEPVDPPLVLTPSVSLVPAPGHNWGHVGVRIENGGELAIYPGHLVLTPFDVADPDAPDDNNPHSTTAAATRRAFLEELADRDGLLLTTLLGGSGGGRVLRRGAGFELAPTDG